MIPFDFVQKIRKGDRVRCSGSEIIIVAATSGARMGTVSGRVEGTGKEVLIFRCGNRLHIEGVGDFAEVEILPEKAPDG